MKQLPTYHSVICQGITGVDQQENFQLSSYFSLSMVSPFNSMWSTSGWSIKTTVKAAYLVDQCIISLCLGSAGMSFLIIDSATSINLLYQYFLSEFAFSTDSLCLMASSYIYLLVCNPYDIVQSIMYCMLLI